MYTYIKKTFIWRDTVELSIITENETGNPLKIKREENPSILKPIKNLQYFNYLLKF